MKQTVFIYEKKGFYWILTCCFSLILAFLLFNPNENFIEFFHKNPSGVAILLLVFGTGFIFFLLKAVRPKPVITISDTGIVLRGHGFFAWDRMISFHTFYDENEVSVPGYIVFCFKEGEDIRYNITHLNRPREVIVTIITEYQNTVPFTGSETIKKQFLM